MLLDKWLLHQPRFTGKAVRALTLRALGTLIGLARSELDALIVLGTRPSHTAGPFSEARLPVKIVSLVVGTLAQELRVNDPNANNEEDGRDNSLEDDMDTAVPALDFDSGEKEG